MFKAYQQIFQQLSFRRFWWGFTFSVLGDALSRVALTWFVYQTTHSAQALGWLMLCYTGPIMVGGLVAGPLLDRFDRRKVMIADNIIRGIAVGFIPLLYSLGRLALWQIYVVAAIYGALMMISLAGGPALVPSLVDSEQLATANALEMLSFTLGGVVGPALAGLLINRIGAANVVVIDVLSYFTFALVLANIQLKQEPVAVAQTERAALRLSDAVALLLNNKILFATTFMFMAFNIGGGLLSVCLPILADQRLHGGAALYGSLLSAIALGEVLSTLVAGSLVLPVALGALICFAQCLSGAALGLALLGPTVWSVSAGLFLYGAFSAPLTIWAQTLRMKIIPERLRGRTFALLRTLMQSGGPLGSALGGILLPWLGIPAMIILSGIVAGVPGILGYPVADLRYAGQPLARPTPLRANPKIASEGD